VVTVVVGFAPLVEFSKVVATANILFDEITLGREYLNIAKDFVF